MVLLNLITLKCQMAGMAAQMVLAHLKKHLPVQNGFVLAVIKSVPEIFFLYLG